MSDALQFGLTSASIALFGGLLVFSAVLIAILGRTFPAGLAALVIGFTSFCAYCAGLLGDVKVLGVVVACRRSSTRSITSTYIVRSRHVSARS